MQENDYNEINAQDVNFVEINNLVDDNAELSAEAVCACGCGMCFCIILFDQEK